MKNFNNSYTNNPELLWIYLLLILASMFFFLTINFLYYHSKIKKVKLLIVKFNAIEESSLRTPLVCNLCGCNRSYKELLAEAPFLIKFKFFFIFKVGFIKLLQVRCGNCNSRLIFYTEQSNSFRHLE